MAVLLQGEGRASCPIGAAICASGHGKVVIWVYSGKVRDISMRRCIWSMGHLAAGVILLAALIYHLRITESEQICVHPSGFNRGSLEESCSGLSARHSQDLRVFSKLSILLTPHKDKTNSSAYCLGTGSWYPDVTVTSGRKPSRLRGVHGRLHTRICIHPRTILRRDHRLRDIGGRNQYDLLSLA